MKFPTVIRVIEAVIVLIVLVGAAQRASSNEKSLDRAVSIAKVLDATVSVERCPPHPRPSHLAASDNRSHVCFDWMSFNRKTQVDLNSSNSVLLIIIRDEVDGIFYFTTTLENQDRAMEFLSDTISKSEYPIITVSITMEEAEMLGHQSLAINIK